MVNFTLAEELLLLAVKPDGKLGDIGAYHTEFACALLLELAVTGAIEARDERLVAVGNADEPLLATALKVVGDDEVLTTIIAVQTDIETDIDKRLGRRLAERGVLEERRHKAFGVIPTTRFPERDPGARRSLRARVDPVLVDGAEPTDPATTRLIALAALSAVALRTLFEGEERQAAFVTGYQIARDLIQASPPAEALVLTAAAGSGSGDGAALDYGFDISGNWWDQ